MPTSHPNTNTNMPKKLRKLLFRQLALGELQMNNLFELNLSIVKKFWKKPPCVREIYQCLWQKRAEFEYKPHLLL